MLCECSVLFFLFLTRRSLFVQSVLPFKPNGSVKMKNKQKMSKEIHYMQNAWWKMTTDLDNYHWYSTHKKKTLKFAFISNMLMFLFHFLRTSANHIIAVCGLILIVFNDMIDHFHLMVRTEPIDRSSDMGWCGKHFPLGMLMSYAPISDFFNLQKNNLYFTCNWWSISLVMKKKN